MYILKITAYNWDTKDQHVKHKPESIFHIKEQYISLQAIMERTILYFIIQ